jgi:diguanylate cyclase
MEELETVFAVLLEVVLQLDTRVHRAVRQARRWVEEDMTFSRTGQEVFEELRARAEMDSTSEPAREVISQMLHRIEAKERADHADAMALSAEFNAVQTDLDRLRNQIARVEVTRAVRYKYPLSIALFDLDRFKALNDAHGHRVGDVVLQALAGRILRMLRQSDYLARYGGEEFAVIFPNTDLNNASIAGEKICSAARGETIPTSAGPLRVTVSIGVASLAPGGSPESLFEDADRALYRAKAAGRDRVEAAEIQIVQTPALSVELCHPSEQGDDEKGPEEDDPQRDGPAGKVLAPLVPQSLDGGAKRAIRRRSARGSSFFQNTGK